MKTPDGTCIHDYIQWWILRMRSAAAQSCAFNLANERGHSVKEVIAATERIIGRSIREGFRIIVICPQSGAKVRLCTRPGHDLTPRLPLIVGALARCL
jgi:hypothetical protein